MPPAARIGDLIKHLPAMLVIVKGCPTVLIGGSPASRVTDFSVPCPLPFPQGHLPAPGTIVKGSASVMIGGLPAARVDDLVIHACASAPTGSIGTGCSTVIIGG
jgi:uncharacterized Zn-binding protein involved in type VI secretion